MRTLLQECAGVSNRQQWWGGDQSGFGLYDGSEGFMQCSKCMVAGRVFIYINIDGSAGSGRWPSRKAFETGLPVI